MEDVDDWMEKWRHLAGTGAPQPLSPPGECPRTNPWRPRHQGCEDGGGRRATSCLKRVRPRLARLRISEVRGVGLKNCILYTRGGTVQLFHGSVCERLCSVLESRF